MVLFVKHLTINVCLYHKRNQHKVKLEITKVSVKLSLKLIFYRLLKKSRIYIKYAIKALTNKFKKII